MALTYSITGASIINQADAVGTVWDAVRWAGSGGAPTAVLDNAVFFETDGSIAMKAAGNNWKSGLAFDWYLDQSNIAQDLTVSGNEMLGMMVLMTTESVALTRAAGGMFFWVSSDTTSGTTAPTTYSEWWVGGSDLGTNGWKQFWIDTRKAPSFTAGTGTAVNISSGNTTTNEITTSTAHGFWTGQTVVIASSDIGTTGNTPAVPTINRSDWEIRVTGASTFVIVNDNGTDVNLSSTGTAVGTVTPEGADLTAVRRFGFGIRNHGSVGSQVKSDNLFCDISFTGFPIYQVVDSDGLGTADWQGFVGASSSGGNGLIERASGAILCNCGFQFGSTSMSANLTFKDENPFNIVFREHLYYGGANRAEERHLINYEDWYSLTAFGNGTNKTSITMGILVGTGDDRRGVNGQTFSTEDIDLQTFNIDFATDIADISAVNMYGCKIVGARDGALFDDGNKTTIIGTTFQKSGLIDIGTTNNGAELFDITFLDPQDRTRFWNDAFKWPSTTSNVTDSRFITTGTPTTQSMILMPAAGSFTFDNIKFFGDYAPSSNNLRHLRTDVSGTSIDENDFANSTGTTDFDNGTVEGVAQSFLTVGSATLRGITVALQLTGTLVGLITAKVYASTGTVGNKLPTGSALATSEELDITKLNTSTSIITFPFNDNVVLSATTHYVFTIEGTQTGDASNRMNIAIDTGLSHTNGNASTWNGTTWTVTGAADVVFEINATQIKISGVNGSNADWTESIGDRPDFTTASSINQVGILTLTSETITITVLDDNTGSAIANTPRVMVLNATTKAEIASGSVNASGIFTATYSGPLPVNITGWVRDADTVGTDYTPKDFSGSIVSGSGFSQTLRLVPLS